MAKILPLLSEQYFKKGLEYFRKNNFNSAIKEFTESIKINPNNELTYFYLGAALDEVGEKEKAKVYFEKSIKLDPNYINPYLMLGNIYTELWLEEKVKKGDTPQSKFFLNKALQAYNEAQRLAPDDNEIKEFIRMLKLDVHK